MLTAGCIDTGVPAGRRNFGQSVKTLIETANVHHARWVMFTETRCEYMLDGVLGIYPEVADSYYLRHRNLLYCSLLIVGGT